MAGVTVDEEGDDFDAAAGGAVEEALFGRITETCDLFLLACWIRSK